VEEDIGNQALREIWRLAWPTVTYSLLQNLVGLIDILMVGRLGSAAISAVGLSRQIVIIVMVIVLSITTGSTTLAAQFYGAGSPRRLSRLAAQSLIMGIVTGVVLGSIGFILTPSMLSLMGAKPDVLQHGTAYMRILFAGMIFMVTGFVIRGLLNGAGDTLTPLKVAAFTNIVNIVANYLLIFGVWGFPRLGVAGAACGTVVARAIGTGIGIAIILSGRFRVRLFPADLRGVSPTMMFKVLRIGIPAGVQGIFRNGARVLLYRIVAATAGGTAAIAATTIGFQIRMLSILPALAINVAAVSLVGRNIGAGRLEKAEEFGWQAVRTCLVLMSTLGFFIFILASPLVRAFTGSLQTIQIGRFMLRFFAFDQLFAALGIVSNGILTGAGDTKPGLVYTIIAQWFFMLPLSCFLVFYAGWDIMGVCLAFTLASALQFGLTLRRVLGGKWKEMKV